MSRPMPTSMTQADYDATLDKLMRHGKTDDEARAALAGVTIDDHPPAPAPLDIPEDALP